MSTPSEAEVHVSDDAEALAAHAADFLLAAARAATGRFAVALSGGSTPKRLYQLLAQAPRREVFPWDRVHWFWGDERFVPHDDPASNYRMTAEAMLSHVPVPPANVHPVPTEGITAAAAAQSYERELQVFYGADTLDSGRPLFDINLLGLGEDGHTASLIPGTSALEERRRWVTTVEGARPETRITLTYPALESSRETIFLVAGEAKREMLARLRQGDAALPAARLRPLGTLRLFVDRAAAR